jgi:hypothetical protein
MGGGPNLAAALEFVHASGKAADLAMLRFVEGHELTDDELDALTQNQNPDGGFKVAELGPPSVVGRTAEMVIYLTALGGGDLGAVQAAADFLIEGQRPDGSWGEAESLAALQPPAHFKPGWADADGWETAACVVALAGLGLPLDYRHPIEFLRDTRTRVRGERYLRLEGLALYAAFRRIEGADSPSAKHMRVEVDSVAPEDLEVFELNWGIYAFALAGAGSSEPLMQAFGKALAARQRGDGGFGSGPKSSPYETALSLGALTLSGQVSLPKTARTGAHDPDPANSDHGI